MNPFNKLSVRASMALFAGIALSALLGLTVLALINMQASEALAQRLLGDVQLARAAGNADMMHDALRADALSAQAAGAKARGEDKQAIEKDLAEHIATFDKALAEVEANGGAPVREALAVVKPDVLAYQAGARALVKSALYGKADEATQKTFDAGFAKLATSLDRLSGLIEAGASASNDEKKTIYGRTRALLVAAAVLAAVLIAACAGLFARNLLRRLGAEPAVLRDFAQQIADGELGARMAGQPATDSVARAMLSMQGTLATAVRAIRSNADGVATASAQIASGNMDLSGRTEKQAAALEETASSMEELSSTVKQNADNAKQANQLALGASTVAIEGGDVVGQVVQTMKGINDSSKKIADIISVIDGIAFQTNILALNAAVEAARAGEQGRGFAVVASEVRSLAGRSADAAKEIKTLITASVERVEQGTALVDKAGATMSEVVTAIKRVTDIMGEISSASQEQSAGVAQVGEAITQMDQATQQNAALVEQSAAAAESLKSQAQQLVSAVAVFKLAAEAPAVVAGTERRSPERAKNVTRPKFGIKAAAPADVEPAPAKTGTDGEWASF